MKGLLIKDFFILCTQKKFFMMILAMGILLTFAGQDITFVMGYMMMVFGIFSGTTITYDEMNHGMSFLLTLPVSRKQYVQSKYLFLILSVAAALAVSFLLGYAGSAVGNVAADMPELAVTGVMMAFVVMAFMSIYLPLILKFGAEKARIAVAVLFGMSIFVGWLSDIISEKADGKLLINLNIGNLSDEAILLLCCAVCALVMLVTYVISVRIMAKRDF